MVINFFVPLQKQMPCLHSRTTCRHSPEGELLFRRGYAHSCSDWSDLVKKI